MAGNKKFRVFGDEKGRVTLVKGKTTRLLCGHAGEITRIVFSTNED